MLKSHLTQRGWFTTTKQTSQTIVRYARKAR